MCIACELGFWMAMDEEPPAKAARKADDFFCEAAAEKAEPKRKAKAGNKPRQTKASAARE